MLEIILSIPSAQITYVGKMATIVSYCPIVPMAKVLNKLTQA